MSDEDSQALDMLRQIFENLDAPADQARVMAGQVLKRARQVAAEQGISEADAMRVLLQKIVLGRRGDYTGAPPEGA